MRPSLLGLQTVGHGNLIVADWDRNYDASTAKSPDEGTPADFKDSVDGNKDSQSMTAWQQQPDAPQS